jgi:glucose/arabinose dehydrogenase
MRYGIRVLSLAVLSLAAAASAQVKFTDAFPGTRFSRPVYFGPFPGKAKTNVVLEQHAGNVLLVSQKAGGGWAKDTLYHMAVHQANEMGLLGIAFHPKYNENHKYYISYNPPGALYDVVEERLADTTGMKDRGGKGRLLFNITDPFENHNGGTIAFGPKDGYLYYGVGDGGDQRDPNGNGQNVNAWLAKMHRIDVNPPFDAGLEYHIPADNPFANGGGRKEIFAYGFRNPWKWSFDPVSGDLWVGDVGQDAVEEVDIVTKGGNYGWKIMEGHNGTNNGKMIEPIFTYNHPTGNCVIGGVVFRGNPDSKYYGTYFTADNGTSLVWNLKKNATGDATATSLTPAPTNLSSFGVDADGRIYACGLNNGVIYYLDSPDLVPSTSLRPGKSWLGAYDRTFTVRPGERVDARAFARSSVLEIFSPAGNRLGALRRDEARLPANMDAGVYLLKGIKGGRSDLLIVR